MARVTATEVKQIIDTDLADSVVDVFIGFANELVDDIASADSSIDSTRLKKIERLLSAHYTALRDPRISEYSVGDASAVFQGSTDRLLDATLYGQQAKTLDSTGTLAAEGRRKASVSVVDAKDLAD